MLDNVENFASETDARMEPRRLPRGPARLMYEALADGNFSDFGRRQARKFLLTQLQVADDLVADLPEDVADIHAWILDGVDRAGRAYRDYLSERKLGAPRRYFANRSHALHFLKCVAPTKLVDGAWLYGLLDHHEDARFADLIRIYLEELGDGISGKNHVVLYQKLLAANDCDHWQELTDDHYVQGAIQLAMACNPRDFLPEIIGFNLGYEQLPLHLPITAYELNELGIDPYYFALHITVDNADTGHAKRALQGLLAALPKQADPTAFYHRVRNGYLLNELGAGTVSVIESFNLQRELEGVFERKAIVGKHMHSDYCRVAGRTVTDWLSTPGQIPKFLRALEASGWIKRHQDPRNSRFWQLLQGERAEMFGVFSGTEQQLIFDWIAGDVPGPGRRGEAGAAAYPPRQPSFRARQRLLGNVDASGLQLLPNARDKSGGERSVTFGGLDSLGGLDADMHMLNAQISGCAGHTQLMKVLAEWMSPALHHTNPGLMATRLFTERFNTATR